MTLAPPPWPPVNPDTSKEDGEPSVGMAAALQQDAGEENQEQQQNREEPFVWRDHWYPVSLIEDLDPSVPTPFQLLGRELVVWKDAQGEWRVFLDKCPHRLAPLSVSSPPQFPTKSFKWEHSGILNRASVCEFAERVLCFCAEEVDLVVSRKGGWMRRGCCNARTMAGLSRETGVVVPFHRQRRRALRRKPDSRLVLVLCPTPLAFRKGCCSCGLTRRDGRKRQPPHRPRCLRSSVIRDTPP
jgi:hypothetical protein